ncbi:IDEAL domain-containing protein [Litchfieldia alkalitelluris]|uniref:IDEAL domain-containing protein n=1 Tax=Litchfieldia alkalitelluris TaxID=304268 RepID=UPI0009980157|nr:IDEAL domain-containing protein [Litchfieldia alkalitelluris]
MSHLNNPQKNEIVPFTAVNEEATVYKKEAEMVLLQSQISFQKSKLMEKIDFTLVNRDEALFMELSKQYITLVHHYSYLN